MVPDRETLRHQTVSRVNAMVEHMRELLSYETIGDGTFQGDDKEAMRRFVEGVVAIELVLKVSCSGIIDPRRKSRGQSLTLVSSHVLVLQASEAGAHNAKVASLIRSRAGKEDSLSVFVVDECHAWLGVHAGDRPSLKCQGRGCHISHAASRVTPWPRMLAQAAPSINS
jgi:hypothetical protein